VKIPLNGMLKQLLFLLFYLSFGFLYSQKPKSIHPFKIDTLTYSKSKEKAFFKSINHCDSLIASIKSDEQYAQLTQEEIRLLDACDKESFNYYDISTLGCSWYCGGGPDSIWTRSTSPASKKEFFDGFNLHDFDHSLRWKSDKTIDLDKEWINFSFSYYSPRVTEVAISNGDVTSKKSYLRNNRAKKINYYYNDTLLGTLELKDLRAIQYFKIDTLGHLLADIDSSLHKNWNLRFEIIETFKKNKPISISEINFNGIDVHCLAYGTLISMANGDFKAIENLNIGDVVLSYNETSHQIESDTILELAQAIHTNLITIYFDNHSKLTMTDDHPILLNDTWASFNPRKTAYNYGLSHVVELKKSSQIQGQKITTIESTKTPQLTYTITKLKHNRSFLANGITVGTE
jgi:hypothetical protein